MSSETTRSPSGRGEFRTEDAVTLSDSGAARRDSVLPFLQEAVVREGDRRRARRIALRNTAAFSLLAALGATFVVVWPTSVRNGTVVDREFSGPTSEPRFRIERLRTEPGVVERYAFSATVDTNAYSIDDREFMNMLASIGRPTGLVRREGRVILTSFTPDPIRVTPDTYSDSTDGNEITQ